MIAVGWNLPSGIGGFGDVSRTGLEFRNAMRGPGGESRSGFSADVAAMLNQMWTMVRGRKHNVEVRKVGAKTLVESCP